MYLWNTSNPPFDRQRSACVLFAITSNYFLLDLDSDSSSLWQELASSQAVERSHELLCGAQPTSCHNQVMISAPPWKSIISHPLCTVCSVFYFVKYNKNVFALGFRHHCLDPICDLWNIKKVWNITLCWNHPPWRERALAKRIITSPSLKSRAGVWIREVFK